MDYIENHEQADETEVWVISNPNSEYSLSTDFTNADYDSLTDEMNEVIKTAFSGSNSFNYSYDSVYGMIILRAGIPIYDDDYNVTGAVMMVSMLERKALGMTEGIMIVGFAVLFSLSISIIMAVIMLKHVSKPLETIDKNIMQIAGGDYSQISITSKSGQLQRLELALSELASNLDKIAKEREYLDKQRMDFFANVSHELRTPITVIKGYAETLDDGIITDENMITDYHHRILRECENISVLVQDLFTLSKLQNPDFAIDIEPVSLLQVICETTEEARVISMQKDISIENKYLLNGSDAFENDEIDPEKEPYLIIGDYKRLRQMFMIIIDNAVKFSDEGGKILITISKETYAPETETELPAIEDNKSNNTKAKENNKHSAENKKAKKFKDTDKRQNESNAKSKKNKNKTVESNDKEQTLDAESTESDSGIIVSIRDYGVGISEEELPNIFQKFYTSKLKQNEKGTGLGLMIAKNIAIKHEAKIDVDSVKGEGTCFSFTFKECTDTSQFE
ncbi:MAG: HAMP domain-containing histidine kinase [Lachnospiraceae bacterium]|nr:HAMP domain-containing histidine kinase [Lachnospiraceae bacterium]